MFSFSFPFFFFAFFWLGVGMLLFVRGFLLCAVPGYISLGLHAFFCPEYSVKLTWKSL